MTALAWVCVYLLGAIITYGACWNYLNTSKIEAELRADHPELTEPAHRIGVAMTCCVLALAWPATAVTALIDAVQGRTARTRRRLDVGQTITIDGQPMLITGISYRDHREGGRTAIVTCASPDHIEGDPK